MPILWLWGCFNMFYIYGISMESNQILSGLWTMESRLDLGLVGSLELYWTLDFGQNERFLMSWTDSWWPGIWWLGIWWVGHLMSWYMMTWGYTLCWTHLDPNQRWRHIINVFSKMTSFSVHFLLFFSISNYSSIFPSLSVTVERLFLRENNFFQMFQNIFTFPGSHL